MPTQKTRLTITLNEYSEELLSSMSSGSGLSKSAVINEIFRLVGPSFVQLANAKTMIAQGFASCGHDAMQGYLDGLKSDVSNMIDEAKKECSGMVEKR